MTFYAQLDHDTEQIDVMATAEIDRDHNGNIEVTLGPVWREECACVGRVLVDLTEADEGLLRAMAAERAML